MLSVLLTALNGAEGLCLRRPRMNQPVAWSLVIVFVVMVLDELADPEAQPPLAEDCALEADSLTVRTHRSVKA